MKTISVENLYGAEADISQPSVNSSNEPSAAVISEINDLSSASAYFYFSVNGSNDVCVAICMPVSN